MTATIKPLYRAVAVGIVSAALLIGAFLLGAGQHGAANSGSPAGGQADGLLLTSSAAGGKITVTGNGSVTGTPDQLVLSMGVQASASSVSTRHLLGSNQKRCHAQRTVAESRGRVRWPGRRFRAMSSLRVSGQLERVAGRTVS